jgi:hypothetical protein
MATIIKFTESQALTQSDFINLLLIDYYDFKLKIIKKF